MINTTLTLCLSGIFILESVGVCMGLSKQYEKCKVCKYKNGCDNKRMVACAYIQEPNSLSPVANDVSQPLMQNLEVKHDYRDIYIDENITITIDLEEMKRRLEKEISKELHCALYFGA